MSRDWKEGRRKARQMYWGKGTLGRGTAGAKALRLEQPGLLKEPASVGADEAREAEPLRPSEMDLIAVAVGSY